MNQPSLFDASRTSPTPCPVGHCPAIRFPNQDRVITCAHDQAVATTDMPGKRPRHCLNTHDPATAPFSPGY